LVSGAVFEGLTNLSITKPEDGKKFKGRDLLPLTGRVNYAAHGRDKGLALEATPETVASMVELNLDVAGW
jgi:putative chitinase